MLNINYDFWNQNGRQLCKPDLECLRQDHTLYKILLMQLVGEIEFDNDGIRLKDRSLAKNKFEKFIEKAIEENVGLAITPEYSCPWINIEETILNNKLPLEEKIWILGCHSIKPKELKEIICKYNNIVWIYDEVLIEQTINEDKFLDPVCIFFKTKDTSSVVKDVVIIQFKTHGFGGNGFQWERDNCISGKTLFVIENQRSSTRLVTIICSDTLQGLNFNTIKDDYFKNNPLLLIHIQLNQKPFQINFKNYRNLLFSKERENLNKEIICLNWARGVTYTEDEEQKTFNKYGGSGLYCKTKEIETSDFKVNHNQSKGLYYTNWNEKKSHIYFLNFDEYLFLINSTKPSQSDSDPSQLERSGPVVLKTFNWNSNEWSETESIDNGFCKTCSEIEDNSGELSCLYSNDKFTDVERIIQLSCGDINFKSEEKWSEIPNLFSYHISDTEVNSRITFTHDPDENSVDKRNEKLLKFYQLKYKIINDKIQTPNAFLHATVEYKESTDSKINYLINLHSENDIRGTGIYLGNRTEHQANSIKANIVDLFKNDQGGKQVIIWFNNPNIETIYDDTRKPEISENVSKSSVSYKKTKQ